MQICLSLESFYKINHKRLLLAQSYSEVKDLEFIIRSCRLKPHAGVLSEKSNKLTLDKWWFDEFGNSLKIIKKQHTNIIYNDLSLDRQKIVCTDPYGNLPMNDVAKISKLAYVCVGKDEDENEDFAIINFLGIDNYFRAYMLMYREWQKISPLVLGMKVLKDISKNLDIKNFIRFLGKNTSVPCVSGQAWLMFLPASKDFLRLMEKEHGVIFSVLL
jgi:hypothetical protein